MTQLVEWLRPLLHRFRTLALKLLGLKRYDMLPNDDRYRRLMDRMLLLESQFNWRLQGLPAAAGHVRLEQLAAVSGSQTMLSLVDELATRAAARLESTP